MTETIKAYCAACGSNQFTFPGQPKDSDMVTCIRCGRQARFGDLKGHVARQAQGLFSRNLRKLMDGPDKP